MTTNSREGNSQMRQSLRLGIQRWHEFTCNSDSDAFSRCDAEIDDGFYDEQVADIWRIVDNIKNPTHITDRADAADQAHDVMVAAQTTLASAQRAWISASQAVFEEPF